MTHTASTPGQAGSAVYSDLVLRLVYDFWVLGVSNPYAWHAPTEKMLAQYDRYVTSKHLDIGVGSGYYLDHCRFLTPWPTITLLDLNNNSLHAAARRIARYNPRLIQADALQPLPLRTKFDSIALNFLLHCMPGPLESKGHLFGELAHLLNPGGVVFGTTILSQGVQPNWFASSLIEFYNRKGIFGNRQDNIASLIDVLNASFNDVTVHLVGMVAFFTARDPKQGASDR